MRTPCTARKSSLCWPQLENVSAKKQRPSAAINKYIKWKPLSNSVIFGIIGWNGPWKISKTSFLAGGTLQEKVLPALVKLEILTWGDYPELSEWIRTAITKWKSLSCVWLFVTPWTIWNSPGRVPEWVAFPFSRASSQTRDRTQVSRIAGRFFTVWAL